VEAHGWVAGIASPGHPGHPPSTQLDAVANKKGLLPAYPSVVGYSSVN